MVLREQGVNALGHLLRQSRVNATPILLDAPALGLPGRLALSYRACMLGPLDNSSIASGLLQNKSQSQRQC